MSDWPVSSLVSLGALLQPCVSHPDKFGKNTLPIQIMHWEWETIRALI